MMNAISLYPLPISPSSSLKLNALYKHKLKKKYQNVGVRLMNNKIKTHENLDFEYETLITIKRFHFKDVKFVDNPYKEIEIESYLPIEIIRKSIQRAEKIYFKVHHFTEEERKDSIKFKIDKLLEKKTWKTISTDDFSLPEKIKYLRDEKAISRATYFRYKKLFSQEFDDEIEIKEALP